MTKPQLTPTQGILVAIDIGKTRNEVLIEIPGHARRRRLTVLNTRADYDRLIDLLSGLGQPVTCAFEATGNYHRPLAWRLLQAGFAVRLISSLALARTREALHNGWDKNDPKDAQVTLHMLRIGASQHYHDPLAAGLNDIQEVSKTHEAIAKAKTEVLHRILTHHLPRLYGAFDVKLLFQALPRCRAPSFSRVLVSSCPETGSDGPHTSGGIGSGRAKAHCDDRREARPRARVL